MRRGIWGWKACILTDTSFVALFSEDCAVRKLHPALCRALHPFEERLQLGSDQQMLGGKAMVTERAVCSGFADPRQKQQRQPGPQPLGPPMTKRWRVWGEEGCVGMGCGSVSDFSTLIVKGNNPCVLSRRTVNRGTTHREVLVWRTTGCWSDHGLSRQGESNVHEKGLQLVSQFNTDGPGMA